MNNVNTATDKRTRERSVPFEASSFSNSSSGDNGASDAGLLRSSSLLVTVRCSTPDRGVLTEAHLNLIMAVNAATNVFIGIGRFDTDGITAIGTYDPADIYAMHRKITGSDSPIASSGGTLFLDGINILPLIPKRGDANFNADGFVLIFLFNRTRTTSNDILRRFNVMCSAQMGLL